MSRVAILIPTMNRSEFMIRQLRYYASVKSPHPIYIGDASNKTHREKVEKEISKLRRDISVHYCHWPELNDRQTIKKLGETATELFCAFNGDDDFLIPNSLTICANFLRENHEYRTTQGKAILLLLEDSGAYGKIKTLGPYWLRKEPNVVTGSERLLDFSRNYWVPQFSVHRTEEFVKDSEYYSSVQDRSFGELIHTHTFMIRGKTRFVDCLYLVRQAHDKRYSLPDAYDWITSSDWYPSYKLSINALTQALIEVDNIDEKEASKVVKQALWIYLSRGFRYAYNNHNGSGRKGILRQVKNVAKQVPCMKSAYNFLRSACYPSKHLSLPVLLNKRSPYHDDFMPVYKVITSLEEKFTSHKR